MKINITDKLSTQQPQIVIGEDAYEVNDSMEIVLKFQELSQKGTEEGLLKAVELTLGEQAVEKLQLKKMSLSNFKILVTAIMAAVQGVDYEVAARRFQEQD